MTVTFLPLARNIVGNEQQKYSREWACYEKSVDVHLFLVLFASGAVQQWEQESRALASVDLLPAGQRTTEEMTSSATEGEEAGGMELRASVGSMSSDCSPSKSVSITDGTQKSLNLSFPMWKRPNVIILAQCTHRVPGTWGHSYMLAVIIFEDFFPMQLSFMFRFLFYELYTIQANRSFKLSRTCILSLSKEGICR